ncbi:MAG: hypothetical protein R3D57_09810 [Hyphomicrobiaceae bacterium]
MKALAGLAWGLALLAVIGHGAPAQAADKLSDKSIKVLMDWAWLTLPNKFTTPEGKVIVVDKTKKDEVIVPIDVARHIIEIARLSAHAQICQLVDKQVENYQTLMRVEEKKKIWTDQQMLYIHNLHTFTVQLLAGGIKVTIEDGATKIDRDTGPAADPVECSEDQKKNVEAEINAYLDSVKKEGS